MGKQRRQDPFFGKQTPLLFAHRGGAKEIPESTRRGFEYAWTVAGADVLELDVQVTKGDEQFVVWHGPSLDKVRIGDTLPTDRPKSKDEITEFSWAELKGNAWVAPPSPHGPDFAHMECNDHTRLLLLEEMMALFPDAPLNIEMKDDSFRRDHVARFLQVLDAHRGARPILVVSQSDALIDRFRMLCQGRYPTGLSVREVLLARVNQLLPLVNTGDFTNRALQSSYAPALTPERLVEDVQTKHGAVHVFLNGIWFLVDELDATDGTPTREQLFAILDRGVDGIMTDRPGWVRPLIDEWIGTPS